MDTKRKKENPTCHWNVWRRAGRDKNPKKETDKEKGDHPKSIHFPGNSIFVTIIISIILLSPIIYIFLSPRMSALHSYFYCIFKGKIRLINYFMSAFFFSFFISMKTMVYVVILEEQAKQTALWYSWFILRFGQRPYLSSEDDSTDVEIDRASAVVTLQGLNLNAIRNIFNVAPLPSVFFFVLLIFVVIIATTKSVFLITASA